MEVMLEYDIKPKLEPGEERESSGSEDSGSEEERIPTKKKGKAIAETSRDPISSGGN